MTEAEQAAADAAAAQAAADEAAAAKAAEAAKNAPKQFSQAEVDALVGKVRGEGRVAAEKELLKTLGVPDLAQAQAVIEGARAKEDENKTELEKAQKELTRLQTVASEAQAHAAEVLVSTRVEGALRDAGVNAARLASALKLVDRSAITVKDGVVEGVEEAVKAVKDASPEWFGAVHTAADASGGTTRTPFADLSPAERRKAYAEHGIRLP